MVISNSTWIRPAQAIIYTDSGETKYFPPRNRGSLPRALTFRDHNDCRSAESSTTYLTRGGEKDHVEQYRLNKTDVELFSAFPNDNHVSFLVASNELKCDIDDPPDEYQSFEHDYFQFSTTKERHSYMDQDIPSMSTPTDQYSDVLKHRKCSEMEPLVTPSHNLQQASASPISTSQSDCISPLLQANHENLPLDVLVDLYTKKMESARAQECSKSKSDEKAIVGSFTSGEEEMHSGCQTSDKVESVLDCHMDVDKSSHLTSNDILCKSHDRNCACFCSPFQLMAFDIQLLLHELDVVIGRDDKSAFEDLMCVPTQELESLLINCCRKTVEFVMME